MHLPKNQMTLIDALIRTGKKIAVVLFGGTPFELPFAEDVQAILNMYLPGQNGGTAVEGLLFGLANPGGRLAETWPFPYSDVPFGETFGKTENEVYRESIYVGYSSYSDPSVATFEYGKDDRQGTFRDQSPQRAGGERMRAIRKRTEYLYNPVGIGVRSPHLFWNCEGGKT